MTLSNRLIDTYSKNFAKFATAMRNRMITPDQFKFASDNFAYWQAPNDIESTTTCPSITIEVDWLEQVYTYSLTVADPYRFYLTIAFQNEKIYAGYFDSPAEALDFLNNSIENNYLWQVKVKNVWTSCGFSC